MNGLTYNGSGIKPTPFVSFEKEYQTTDDGRIIGSLFQITLKGKLLPDMGSPTSAGVFWVSGDPPASEVMTADNYLKSILRKQESIRKLFANEGQRLCIIPYDGGNQVFCNPRIKRLSFPEGNRTSWANQADYTVLLEADVIYNNVDTNASGVITTSSGLFFGEDTGDPSGYKVSKANEEWNIEAADERARSYRVTHSVSATGKRFYSPSGTLDKEAWENAKTYVTSRLGLGLGQALVQASNVFSSDFEGFNYVRSQHIGESQGTYTVSETWLAFDTDGGPPAIEEFNVDVRTADNGLSHVAIQGTINGLARFNNNNYTEVPGSGRWENAQAKWATIDPFSRSQTISGLTLNSVPLSTQVGYNQIFGIVTYNYEYDNRATAAISGARSELITVSVHNPSDLFANLTVPFRSAGPILQDLETVSISKKTVQIEAVMPAKRIGYSPAQPNTNALVATYAPSASSVFVDQNDETWVEQTGRYTRTTSWTYGN